MTPLLLLSHGQIGSVLLQGAEAMYGALPQVQSLALEPSESPEAFAERVKAACAQLPGPPLVLVDMACGTPWNVALRCGLIEQGEVLAGLSLPLLLEALGLRDTLAPKPLAAELVQRAAGSFMRASAMLDQGGKGCA